MDTTFKTDILKVVLVFLISNFFPNKKSKLYIFDKILLSESICWQFWVISHDISTAIYYFSNCFLYLTPHLKMILVIRNETKMRPQITSMFQCAAELRGRKCILRTTKWAKEAKKVTKRKEKNVKSGELNMMWKLTWDVKINFSCQNTQCISIFMIHNSL